MFLLLGSMQPFNTSLLLPIMESRCHIDVCSQMFNLTKYISCLKENPAPHVKIADSFSETLLAISVQHRTFRSYKLKQSREGMSQKQGHFPVCQTQQSLVSIHKVIEGGEDVCYYHWRLKSHVYREQYNSEEGKASKSMQDYAACMKHKTIPSQVNVPFLDMH